MPADDFQTVGSTWRGPPGGGGFVAIFGSRVWLVDGWMRERERERN